VTSLPLTGRTLRTKVLPDGCGISHTITVLLPECSESNRKALIAAERAWRAEVKLQPVAQRERASLAVDTAWIASQSLCRDDLGPAHDHYIVAAQDETGTLRGLSIFYYDEPRKVWWLALHSRDPHDQGGSSASCQIRGVGSELLGADADLMTSRICTTVELHPLDTAAANFWRARGFTTRDGKPCADLTTCQLSCQGLQGLRSAYAHTPTEDQDMLCHQLTGVYGRLDYSLQARFSAARG